MAEDKKEKDTGIEIFSETIPEQLEDGVSSLEKPDSNASSVKVKKSGNIFSAIVRRARRRRASRCRSNEVKELHVSSQNLSGGSTISFGVHVEEVELHSQTYERKLKQWDSVCSETNTSHHSLDLPGKDTAGPLINLIGENQNLQNQDEKSISHEDAKNEGNEIISAFINFGKPTLNISLIDALQYIQETINNMHENESHLINLITKHIQEQTHQKEIMNSISYHTKLQWEAERRSCSIANDIWMQQLEIGRAQERTLQTTLNSLVKQNRQLQIENENLYRKYEKIARKYQMSPDHKLRYPHADVSCDGQMEAVFRHNEKLQVKLETLFKKIESLEGELCLFQKQNDTMEQQLRNSTIKVQNQKVAMQRLKTDHELEKTTLYYKLDLKDQQFKEATELGDIVLEDIDAIKRHLKTVSFNAEWSKPKQTGNDVTDLIHLCRTCINELSKELTKVHNENILKDRDM
ncbi:girdin-like isoform X2 [Sitophilus oryzae]|uniref:Girdin-like isoform X2 n=1 Tax=Sitophilus oryzae TaxID=7048 RepID=A0A6J2YUX0_SITOR|nr:girdin-like isoform X2 [Sitophilus oryzae]